MKHKKSMEQRSDIFWMGLLLIVLAAYVITFAISSNTVSKQKETIYQLKIENQQLENSVENVMYINGNLHQQNRREKEKIQLLEIENGKLKKQLEEAVGDGI